MNANTQRSWLQSDQQLRRLWPPPNLDFTECKRQGQQALDHCAVMTCMATRDEIRAIFADPQLDGMEALYEAIGRMLKDGVTAISAITLDLSRYFHEKTCSDPCVIPACRCL